MYKNLKCYLYLNYSFFILFIFSIFTFPFLFQTFPFFSFLFSALRAVIFFIFPVLFFVVRYVSVCSFSLFSLFFLVFFLYINISLSIVKFVSWTIWRNNKEQLLIIVVFVGSLEAVRLCLFILWNQDKIYNWGHKDTFKTMCSKYL